MLQVQRIPGEQHDWDVEGQGPAGGADTKRADKHMAEKRGHEGGPPSSDLGDRRGAHRNASEPERLRRQSRLLDEQPPSSEHPLRYIVIVRSVPAAAFIRVGIDARLGISFPKPESER